MAYRCVDPTFTAGRWVFGFTLPGQGPFGRSINYVLFAVFGSRAFGGQIPSWNEEEEMLRFKRGAPIDRATGPWPVTPYMCISCSGQVMHRVIHRRFYGRNMVRRYTPYAGSAKEYLSPWCNKMGEAMFLWLSLSPEMKSQLEKDSKRRGNPMLSHNYFVHLYIKGDIRWLDYV